MTRLSAMVATIWMVTAGCALSAPPVLRAADAHVVIASPTSCDVRLSLTIDDAAEVEHRLSTTDGDVLQLVSIEGARAVEPVHDVGSTRSLRVRPTRASYVLQYHVEHREPLRDRCPIWLPTIATDGRSRAVRITIELPTGSTAGARGTLGSRGRTMPSFTWNGTIGTATLSHLPSVVTVPYAASGETLPWSLPGAIDTLAVGTFAAATAVWIWRVRR